MTPALLMPDILVNASLEASQGQVWWTLETVYMIGLVTQSPDVLLCQGLESRAEKWIWQSL